MQCSPDNTIRLADYARGGDLRDTPSVPPRLEAFVGRELELAALTGALDDGVRGRGGTVILRGESGIGKSRLAEEAASLAADRGYTVVWGRSWEAGGAPSFWPWVQAIRSLCRDLDPELLSESIRGRLATLLPELDDSSSAPAPGWGDVTEPTRFRRLDAFASALCELAARSPILVVLDDLHASDFCTLALLDFIGRPLHSARVVVLGTLRDREAQSSPHAALLGRITQDARTIALGPLGASAVRDYLSRTIGDSDPGELAEALHARTDGHPLFMVELLRLLAGSTAGSAEVVWRLNLPRGLEQTLRMRTSELSTEDHAVLEMAAIMGRDVSLARLAEAFDLDPERARAAAEAASALGIFLALTPDRYRFSHILVRDVLEHDLPDDRRWAGPAAKPVVVVCAIPSLSDRGRGRSRAQSREIRRGTARRDPRETDPRETALYGRSRRDRASRSRHRCHGERRCCRLDPDIRVIPGAPTGGRIGGRDRTTSIISTL